MKTIEIVPRVSMGELRLGVRIEGLPKGATLSGPAGTFGEIKFLISDGVVEDVWIEDLRHVSADVLLAGQVIPRDASLDHLKKIFGPCEKVGVKGGVFFNCGTGVTLGTDFEEKGKFIQIRLKPR